mmetsp:Transcript_133387/g.231718  ORF Transcript_133387/g.231718 Transcript_133387/m.231718 type:complete len:206 (-) Transcript_133387:1882-2499(-)
MDAFADDAGEGAVTKSTERGHFMLDGRVFLTSREPVRSLSPSVLRDAPHCSAWTPGNELPSEVRESPVSSSSTGDSEHTDLPSKDRAECLELGMRIMCLDTPKVAILAGCFSSKAAVCSATNAAVSFGLAPKVGVLTLAGVGCAARSFAASSFLCSSFIRSRSFATSSFCCSRSAILVITFDAFSSCSCSSEIRARAFAASSFCC